MKRRNRPVAHALSLLLLLLTLCALFVGCSSKGSAVDRNESLPSKPEDSLGFLDEEKVEASLPADRLIIKTYSISAETVEFDRMTEALNGHISACGGYVERSSTSGESLNSSSSSYSRYASYTIRIPAEHAEQFVTSVGSFFNVTSNVSEVEDISETYYSIEARLEELEAERDSLLDILNADETKKDYDLWLTVKQRLSEVSQQIAVYQGQINRYDSQVSYSTVNLSVREVLTYQTADGRNGFGSRLGNAFKDGWNGFVIGLQDFVVWLAEALPVLCLLGLIATGAVLLIRHSVRRKRKG